MTFGFHSAASPSAGPSTAIQDYMDEKITSADYFEKVAKETKKVVKRHLKKERERAESDGSS